MRVCCSLRCHLACDVSLLSFLARRQQMEWVTALFQQQELAREADEGAGGGYDTNTVSYIPYFIVLYRFIPFHTIPYYTIPY